MDLQILSASQVKLTVEQEGARQRFKSGLHHFKENGKKTSKNLTFIFTEEGVKWVVAVVLDYRLVLVLKTRHKLKPSVEQSLGFSTINY